MRSVIFWMFSAVTAAALAQAPAPAAGVVAGQVVDGTTGRPVSAVVVTLRGAGSQQGTPRILTGADGRFLFKDLAAGSFTLTATKNGYAEGAHGRHRPGGTTQQIVLSPAQRSADVAIRMWKNAAIGGTVADEAGEPVVGVQVRVLGRTTVAGRRRFSWTAGAMTDDRGMYRFSNLMPGEYMVVASPPALSGRGPVGMVGAQTGRGSGESAAFMSGTMGVQVGDALLAVGRGAAVPPPPVNGRVQIYPPTFHPSAHLAAQGATIVVGSGEERANVDIQLQPVTTARVSGTLLLPSGPAPMASVRLVPASTDDVDAAGLAPLAAGDARGAFVFAAVVPGNYFLRGNVRQNANEHFWVDMPITVGGADVDGVLAALRPALSLSGRIEFDGTADRPLALQLPIRLELADGTAAPLPPVNSGSTLSFRIAGYAAGTYLVRPSASPPGWMFKSAMLDGIDVSETPFAFTRDLTDMVLTFTDRWSGVSGTVQGAGADAALVVVFPTDAARWTSAGSTSRRIKSARASPRGTFGISSLPPGDYYVVALRDNEASDWNDPKSLETLARLATHISIAEGEHRTIDLPLREAKQ